MEDIVARTSQTPYTEQEIALADGLNVEPELIRALRELAQRVRETNVISRANPLVG